MRLAIGTASQFLPELLPCLIEQLASEQVKKGKGLRLGNSGLRFCLRLLFFRDDAVSECRLGLLYR